MFFCLRKAPHGPQQQLVLLAGSSPCSKCCWNHQPHPLPQEQQPRAASSVPSSCLLHLCLQIIALGALPLLEMNILTRGIQILSLTRNFLVVFLFVLVYFFFCFYSSFFQHNNSGPDSTMHLSMCLVLSR